MENKVEIRNQTLACLVQKTMRLRSGIEVGHRRIIDLKQGAIQARALRREQDIQIRMGPLSRGSSAEEAEELIARVLGRDDPFEHSEILSQINNDLTHGSITDRMTDAGLGDATRATAASVLDRIKATKCLKIGVNTMQTTRSDNNLIMFFNGAAVVVAYGMLALSLYLSTEVPLSTKRFWGIGILLLTLALVNFVKYRFDDRLSDDRIQRLEDARNEKLLLEYVSDKVA